MSEAALRTTAQWPSSPARRPWELGEPLHHLNAVAAEARAAQLARHHVDRRSVR
jgi:hypothetical protein